MCCLVTIMEATLGFSIDDNFLLLVQFRFIRKYVIPDIGLMYVYELILVNTEWAVVWVTDINLELWSRALEALLLQASSCWDNNALSNSRAVFTRAVLSYYLCYVVFFTCVVLYRICVVLGSYVFHAELTPALRVSFLCYVITYLPSFEFLLVLCWRFTCVGVSFFSIMWNSNLCHVELLPVLTCDPIHVILLTKRCWLNHHCHYIALLSLGSLTLLSLSHLW